MRLLTVLSNVSQSANTYVPGYGTNAPSRFRYGENSYLYTMAASYDKKPRCSSYMTAKVVIV